VTVLDITTMLVRGVHVAALLSAFGALTFIAVMSKTPHGAPCLRGTLHRLTQASAVCALVASAPLCASADQQLTYPKGSSSSIGSGSVAGSGPSGPQPRPLLVLSSCT